MITMFRCPVQCPASHLDVDPEAAVDPRPGHEVAAVLLALPPQPRHLRGLQRAAPHVQAGQAAVERLGGGELVPDLVLLL